MSEAIHDSITTTITTALRYSSVGETTRYLLLGAVMLCAITVGISDPHLFGRNEPREAEIARETLADGHWITPHLCGLPFLEKPPLYYDLVAAAYKLSGSIRPAVARSVTALFAIVMLATVFFLTHRLAGLRSAWFSTLILLAMPQFYYYSHTIVLDMTIGAFCTVALAAFIYWAFWTPRSHRRKFLCLFYFACAGAFLSKGMIGVFHIVLIVGAFLLICRPQGLLRELVSPLPMLVFLVPVTAWICLYYWEGGTAYLYEHFVNNTIGRFFHVHFVVPGMNFHNTDIGKQRPWHFYLSNLFRIAGVAAAILPLALLDEWKEIRRLRRSSAVQCRSQADLSILLILWALLPPIVLSFSCAKETSYILPSYSAIAVLAACWVDRRLTQAGFDGYSGVGWLVVVVPFAAMSLLLSEMPMRFYLLFALGLFIPIAVLLAFLFYRRMFVAGTFLTLAMALSAAMVYHSPRVMLQRDGCYLSFARHVWAEVGAVSLFLYRPNDPIRGSIPFSLNRTVREIDTPEQLRVVVSCEAPSYVLIPEAFYNTAKITSAIHGANPSVVFIDCQTDRAFVLVGTRSEPAPNGNDGQSQFTKKVMIHGL